MRMLQRLALASIALAMLASCGMRAGIPPESGAMPDVGQLDALRGTSDTTPQTAGVDYLASSGPPSVTPHPTQSTWAVLDGDLNADGNAWAIWRITLNAGQTPQAMDVHLPGNYPRRYWIAYADFAAGRWQFITENANQFGIQNAQPHIEPPDPGAMLSPNLNMYVAVIVRGGQSPSSAINVGYLEATYTPVTGPDPIFDDFENNDQLETSGPNYDENNKPYPLPGAGMYHASIHETYNTGMSNPAEFRDKYDFYSIDIPFGQEATITLRHEPQNHFAVDPPSVDYTDLDLLFYPQSATLELDDFIESASSFEVFYGFEQIHLTTYSGTYKLGIIPDISDQGYEDNAEYDLGIFFSDSTHTVSGKMTQAGANVDKRFVVFLEPGNFNAPTNFDSGHEGEFNIEGVPDGTYTLKVQGSAAYDQTGYVYPETLAVTVAGSNVSGKFLDISAFPPPP